MLQISLLGGTSFVLSSLFFFVVDIYITVTDFFVIDWAGGFDLPFLFLFFWGLESDRWMVPGGHKNLNSFKDTTLNKFSCQNEERSKYHG